MSASDQLQVLGNGVSLAMNSNGDSPQRVPEISTPDGAGLEWDEVAAANTTDGGHSESGPKSSEHAKQLCGYLHKQSQKGPLKVWKTRWFVFDEQRCYLYYCNQKNEPVQGKIDISTATLSYEVENLPKHQFEINSEGKVTSIQAKSNEVMIYWLTTLQKKRRNFSARRKRMIMDNHPSSDMMSPGHGGLINGEATPIFAEVSDDSSLPVPADLEDPHAFDSFGGALLNSRAAVRKSWIGKLSAFGGANISPGNHRKSQSFNSAGQKTPTSSTRMSVEHSPEPVSDTSPDSSLNLQATAGVGGGDHLSPPIRPNKLSGRNITNRLSVLVNRGKLPKSETCPNCVKSQGTISYLEHELSIKEREVKDRDEINEFLRKEIRLGDMREKVKEELTVTPEEGAPSSTKVDVLLQREQALQEMQRLLEELTLDRNNARDGIESKEKDLKELKEQIELYKEAVTAKDHVVVELTNQIFQLEHKGEICLDPKMPMFPPSTQSLAIELKSTKEALEAYKSQNQFLSSEIVELNTIRSNENETLKVTSGQLHEMEAKYYKMESKHMILLQETQQPKLDNDVGNPNSEIVSQMLKEALESEKEPQANKIRSNSYGFSHTCVGSGGGDGDGGEDNPLMVKARKLDQQARTVESAMDEVVVSRKTKWNSYMSTGGLEMQRTVELKQLIRSGIPQEYRSKVWSWIIRDTVGKRYKTGEYESILKEHAGQSSIAVNQIELDLLRTLPTNKYYEKPDAQGIDKLRRVLVAFSWFDASVGYCQGLNRLAAIALLFLSEEDSFWCMVAIVQHLLPSDYYSHTLLGSQTDQRVLRDLLQYRSAKLSQHLSLCEIDFSLITFNWFHTIYVDNLPVETMLRIWDTFLYEGSKVLFRFAYAIFKYNEERILSASSSIGIFDHLRTMCQESHDIDTLVQMGFVDVKNFSKRWIDNKRSIHRQKIKEELEELDSIRIKATSTPEDKKSCGNDIISFDSSKEDLRFGSDHVDSGSEMEEDAV